ncbi:MAG TPA: hypothetical protein VGW33_12070 [Terriglobia bacterium]|nr:hypothetical protein [Terriglobia bacterium]
MHALRDPGVWSAIVALLALVLSQLPPVAELVKRRALKLVIPDQVGLNHYMGSTQVDCYVSIHNVGGRALTVARLECLIISADGPGWRLPGESYYARQTQGNSGQWPLRFPLEWMALKPGEHWSEGVHFAKPFSLEDEEKVVELGSRIRNNINAKLNARRDAGLPPRVEEADDALVNEARQFFESHFKLSKGNFQLLFAALSENDELLALRGFNFTLFESSVRTLRSATDDYKFGAGVYFPNADQYKVLTARLHPQADDEAAKAYKKYGTA